MTSRARVSLCAQDPHPWEQDTAENRAGVCGVHTEPQNRASPTPAPVRNSLGTAVTQGLSEAQEEPPPCLFNHPPRIFYS